MPSFTLAIGATGLYKSTVEQAQPLLKRMANTMQLGLPDSQTTARMRLPRIWQKPDRTQVRSHVSRYADPVVTRCSQRCSVRAQAGKGFGKTQEAQSKPADKRAGNAQQASKRRNVKPQANELGPAAQGWQQQDGVQPFDDAFESRLRGLQDQSLQRGTTTQQQQQQLPPLATKDIYAEPPPLSQTLFGNKDKDEKKTGGNSPTYFSQKVLTGFGLGLTIIFLLSTTFSGVLSPTDSGGQQGPPSMSDEMRAQAQKRAKDFEAQYASESSNMVALEGAAVTYAQLGEYKQAESLLTKLTSAKPDLVEAWRLLAETRAKLSDFKRSAAAYEKAISMSPSLTILQGLVGAYVDGGQYQTAIDAIKSARQKLTSTPEELANLGYGETELDLLLGRTYAQWPGHDSQAMEYYNQLITNKPDDFRGYLARGVLFRGQGRQGDAWRMFIQARGMAPQESKTLVDRVINR